MTEIEQNRAKTGKIEQITPEALKSAQKLAPLPKGAITIIPDASKKAKTV